MDKKPQMMIPARKDFRYPGHIGVHEYSNTCDLKPKCIPYVEPSPKDKPQKQCSKGHTLPIKTQVCLDDRCKDYFPDYQKHCLHLNVKPSPATGLTLAQQFLNHDKDIDIPGLDIHIKGKPSPEPMPLRKAIIEFTGEQLILHDQQVRKAAEDEFDWIAEHIKSIRVSISCVRLELEYIDDNGLPKEFTYRAVDDDTESIPTMLHKAIAHLRAMAKESDERNSENHRV